MADAPAFRVLGPIGVESTEGSLPLGPPLRRAVLAALLAQPDRPVSTEHLVEQLWPGLVPASARAQIQNHVSALRRLLPPSAELLTSHRGYRLVVPVCDRDDLCFRADVREARRLRATGELAAATATFGRALGRWHGPAYDGVDVTDVRGVAAQLDELRLVVVEDWAESVLAGDGAAEGGDPAATTSAVVELLAAEVERHPLRERMRGLLMRALDAAGRRAAALAVFRAGRRLLNDQLGVEPGPALQNLHVELLAGGRPPTLPGPVLLPAELSDLTGRGALAEACLAELSERALLCLSGPAGIGKTALAVHLAHRAARRFPDGRILARLGEDPGAVERVLAGCLRALGVGGAALPEHQVEREQLLRERLSGRAVLLVLDGALDQAQVRAFLPDAGRSAVVVTSRPRLDGLDGAVQHDVPLLGPDDGADLLGRIAGPERLTAEPAATARLVDYCDGLPLALRIVGSRLAARPDWTAGDLAARLAEERSRLDWLRIGDRAVRTAFRATCAHLSPAERTLFRRIATLSTRDVPSWTAGALLEDVDDAELVLDRLVEAHLVEAAGRDPVGPRYRMHDLLRLFGRELAAAEEDPSQLLAARRRAYDGWLALAQAAGDADPGWIARDPEPEPTWRPPAAALAAAAADARGWFGAEHAAALAAVRDAADAGMGAVAWALAQRLVGYFDAANRLTEWEQACAAGLRAARADEDTRGEACMLRFQSEALRLRGDLAAAMATAETAGECYARVDPDRGLATTYVRRAVIHQIRRELDVADDLLVMARPAAERVGDPVLVANVVHLQAAVLAYRGESAAAIPVMRRAQAAYDEGGCRHGVAQITGAIGLMAKRLGRYAEARRALTAAQAAADAVGDASQRAHWDSYLAEVLSAQGEHEAALALSRPAVGVQIDSGDLYSVAVALTSLGAVTEAALGPAAALPVLEEAVQAWGRAGIPAPKVADQLAAVRRAAEDDDAAERSA